MDRNLGETIMNEMYCSSEFTKFCKVSFVNPTIRIRLLDDLEQDIFDEITKKIESFYSAKISSPFGTSGFDVSFDKEMDSSSLWDIQSLVYAILDRYACEEKNENGSKEEKEVEKPSTETGKETKTEETPQSKEAVQPAVKTIKPAEKGKNPVVQSAPLT